MLWLIALVIICITTIICNVFAQPSCRHIWRKHDERTVIKMRYNNDEYKQHIETLICESCGKIIRVNLTTGEKTDICEGGPAYTEGKTK